MGLLCSSQLRELRARQGWVLPREPAVLSSEHMLLAQWSSWACFTLDCIPLFCLLLSFSLSSGNPGRREFLLCTQASGRSKQWPTVLLS